MKLAIISDIHGNWDAFQQVLADIDTRQPEQVICLGDCIGYGPEPEAVIVEVRRRQLPTLIGNHEMAVSSRIHLDWFNPLARESLQKTYAMLSEASLDFIRQLPFSLVTAGCRCVHGYPPDSARTYLFQKSSEDLKRTFESMAEPICFVGHTHDLEIITFDGQRVERNFLSQGATALRSDYRYIINVGSVGQPRDGNNQAKYVLWDQTSGQIDVRFITYDIASAAAKIKAAGLPQAHADRLW